MTSLLKEWFNYFCEMQSHITACYDENSLQHTMNDLEDAVEMALPSDQDFDTDGVTTQALNEYTVQMIMEAFENHEGARFISKNERARLKMQAELLLRKQQVEQRSAQWYQEMTGLLTASELGTILKPNRTRGQLVLAKARGDVRAPTGAPMAVPSELMSAFDWGIRFEPVIKMIYEAKFPGTKVHEVGRLYHPTLARCAASPDGVVLGTSERAGRLLEIKCPVTRDISSATIPEDYYAQMQQQLEVTDLEECDYMEVKIRSRYSSETPLLLEGEALYRGVLWRIDYDEAVGSPEERSYSYYLYGAINDMSGKVPPLPEGHHVAETVPWEAVKINLITVNRNSTWWAMPLVKIEEFWADVEKARSGTFVLPASSRKTKVEKEDEGCLFVLPSAPSP